MYQATEYAILLHNYTRAFSPRVVSGDHSYCSDFSKSLTEKLFLASNPPWFSIYENYPWEIYNLKLCTVYTVCGRFNQNVAQRVCDYQIEWLNMIIHLKTTLPLWKTCVKSYTWAVWISNGEAHFATLTMYTRDGQELLAIIVFLFTCMGAFIQRWQCLHQVWTFASHTT